MQVVIAIVTHDALAELLLDGVHGVRGDALDVACDDTGVCSVGAVGAAARLTAVRSTLRGAVPEPVVGGVGKVGSGPDEWSGSGEEPGEWSGSGEEEEEEEAEEAEGEEAEEQERRSPRAAIHAVVTCSGVRAASCDATASIAAGASWSWWPHL